MAVKTERKDKEQESYYSKVKAENEVLKERVAWLDNDSFLLDSNADIRNAYIYMKKNPASARFIYQKYKPLQPIIKEICDPENPLYLDGVKTALDGIVDLESDKENVEQLKAEKIQKPFFRSFTESPYSPIDFSEGFSVSLINHLVN